MGYDDSDDQERQNKLYNEFLKNDAIQLELDNVYLQESSSWAKMHYKIIFINDSIAVGQKVYCGIYNSSTANCGSYEMFRSSTGEKYRDSRLEYRLKKKVNHG